MKLTSFPKTISCQALLLCWGTCAPPATAQYQGSHPLYQDIFIPAPPQTVEVHTPRNGYNAVFESEVRVLPNGTAIGSLTLIPTDSAPRHSGGATSYLARLTLVARARRYDSTWLSAPVSSRPRLARRPRR